MFSILIFIFCAWIIIRTFYTMYKERKVFKRGVKRYDRDSSMYVYRVKHEEEAEQAVTSLCNTLNIKLVSELEEDDTNNY